MDRLSPGIVRCPESAIFQAVARFLRTSLVVRGVRNCCNGINRESEFDLDKNLDATQRSKIAVNVRGVPAIGYLARLEQTNCVCSCGEGVNRMLLSLARQNAARLEKKTLDSYPLFDWLRFLLASVVALSHAQVIAFANSGNLAVQVFFALSGWLIGGILLKSTRDDLRRFYFNRATRIWFPYFSAVTVLYFVSLFRDQINPRWFEFLFYDLTFTHNWFSLKPDAAIVLQEMPLRGTGNHFWSISVEEQFYLAAPLIILMVKFGKTPLIWGVASSVLLLSGLTDFASISLGVLAATLKRERGDWHLQFAAVAVFVIVAVCSFAALMNDTYYPFAAPFLAICVIMLAARPGPRRALGMFAGAVSYPMYLNHWIGLFLAHGVAKHLQFAHPFVTGVVGYLGGVLAGVAAYVLVDKIVMAKRDAFYSRAIGSVSGITAYCLVSSGLVFGVVRWTLM